MSGDGHTNETRELNLDDVEVRLRQVPHMGDWLSVPALVAEVRRLRESEARVLAWIETWERESLERGPNDKIHSAGVASLLRLAVRRPAAKWVAAE